MKQNYVKVISGAFLTGLLLFTSCQSTREVVQAKYEITGVNGGRTCLDSIWDAMPDKSLTAILEPYKVNVDEMMYTVIGVSEMKMDQGQPEGLLSNLVADVLRSSAECILKQPADIGLINMGGLRNILPEGDITVSNIYEILPFENSLCVLTMKGKAVKTLLETIATLRNEGLSGVAMQITSQGKLVGATIQGEAIEDNKDYTIGTIDYLADGNDGLTPLLLADKRECPDEMTLRGIFLDYVKQQTAAGKKITAKLDGRITIVSNSSLK